MNDGAEIKAGKNPLDPKDDLFELIKGKKVVLHGINFDTNKFKVLPESEWILEKARASMVAYPDVTVVIVGHTDNVGSDEDNRTLSQKRAQSVKDWLVAKGIDAGRMKVVGKGETEPMASNDTDDGRAQNRRMEFLVE
jgi:outer membrane protein OmpA-like peptidoglycan-associated protein